MGRPSTCRLDTGPQLAVLLVNGEPGIPPFLAELAGSGRYRSAGRVSVPAQVGGATEAQPADVVVAVANTAADVELLATSRTWDTPTVVVCAVRPEWALLPCLAAGVRGYVSAPVEVGLVGQAVSAVLRGHTFVDARCTGWLVDLVLRGRLTRNGHGLTLRQLEVVQLVREGLTNREIGRSLGISAETVKSHMQEAMRRLGAHDRLDAAARAEAGPDDTGA